MKRQRVTYLAGTLGASYKWLHVADLVGLFKRGKRVAFWNQFLSDVAAIVGRRNGSHDSGVVEFLVFIQLVPSGRSRSVKMTEMLNVGLYARNYITLYFLHACNALADNKPWYNTLELSDSVLELKD